MAVYLDHFGLAEAPFRITPHPEFFFEGAGRGATLEALVYAIVHDEGIVQVSGEIGSGKTMLCRMLLERLPPQVQTVFLANPSYSRAEMREAIAEELGVARAPGAGPVSIRELQACLLEHFGAGRRVVVLIDEAHAMAPEALEEVRLLSNLEASRHKLLQIVLFGQPELDQALEAPSMRQLKDRITHRFRMRPLVEAEVARYLSHRMRAAGYRGPEVFSRAAVAILARASRGLTRRVNVLADKALLAAFASGEHAVSAAHARAAVSDSEFAPLGSRGARRAALAGVAAGLVALGAAAGAGLYAWLAVPPAVPPAPRAAPHEALTAFPEPPARPPAPAGVASLAPEPTEAERAPIEAHSAPVPSAGSSASQAAPGAEPLLAAAQLKRLLGYSSAGNRLLRERIAAARERLEREPDWRWTLELFLTDNSDPARTERFLLRAQDLVPLEDLYVIPVLAGRRYRIRVTLGVYGTREEALEAARRLPPKYQRAFEVVPRSFAELRAAV